MKSVSNRENVEMRHAVARAPVHDGGSEDALCLTSSLPRPREPPPLPLSWQCCYFRCCAPSKPRHASRLAEHRSLEPRILGDFAVDETKGQALGFADAFRSAVSLCRTSLCVKLRIAT